jgi:hypothetical protein
MEILFPAAYNIEWFEDVYAGKEGSLGSLVAYNSSSGLWVDHGIGSPTNVTNGEDGTIKYTGSVHVTYGTALFAFTDPIPDRKKTFMTFFVSLHLVHCIIIHSVNVPLVKCCFTAFVTILFFYVKSAIIDDEYIMNVAQVVRVSTTYQR